MKERRSFSCVVGVSPVACGVRAARCQSRRVLGVSRVVRSHRVVRSLASSRRLSSRVVCRRVVRSLESSRRLSVSVASCAESCRCQSRLVVRRLAARRREESRVIASSVGSLQLSPRREESRVITSSVVSRRLSSSVVSLCVVPLLGVSRVVCGVVSVSVASRRASSRCSASVGLCARRVSRVPFSFQTRWMTFFFVLY